MLKRLLFLLLMALFGAGCSASWPGGCEDWADEVFLNREFDREKGELELTLDLSQTELPGDQRPVAVFMIPNAIARHGNYRYGKFWEKVEPGGELEGRVLGALAAQANLPGGQCEIRDDRTVSGCKVVMVSMTGLVSSCCGYPLAYQASVYLSLPSGSESDVVSFVVIIGDRNAWNKPCIQVIFP